jgi:hypothetical protein
VASGMVAVSVGESADELRSLATWLRDEDEFRGRVGLHEPVESGQMGGVLDSVTVMVSSGTAGALVSSIFTWLARRREVRTVSFKVRSASGQELELTCGSVEDAEVTIGNIIRFLDEA